MTEEVLLQVMADDMQPALVTLSITVLPGDADASGSFDDKTPIVYGLLTKLVTLFFISAQ